VRNELSSTCPWSHLSYAQKWKVNHQLKQLPTQLTLPFLIFLSLSKRQEQERTRERNWRLEMEVEDEVERRNPKSPFHQAQLILMLSMVMVSESAIKP